MIRADGPTTDDIRDIWVDYHLNPLPRAEGIALVPEYQATFDAWLETIRADERERTNTVGGHRQIRDEGRADMCADLRAKVEALQVFNVDSGVDPYRYVIEPLVRRADVLALFDGSSE